MKVFYCWYNNFDWPCLIVSTSKDNAMNILLDNNPATYAECWSMYELSLDKPSLTYL